MLAPGSVRAGGEENKFVIPGQAATVRLQLSLEEDEYKKYQAKVQNADGEQIWSGQILKTRGTRNKRTAVISLPAKLLKKGDYSLIISGVTDAGAVENISEYSFSVSRQQ